MADKSESRRGDESHIRFFDDSVLLEVREEDTQPAPPMTMEERKKLEERHRRKTPPNGSAEGPSAS
jgi:hypothetical protein